MVSESVSDLKLERELLRVKSPMTRAVELSEAVRLRWMDFSRRCRNVARTCCHFGISGRTFHHWVGVQKWRRKAVAKEQNGLCCCRVQLGSKGSF